MSRLILYLIILGVVYWVLKHALSPKRKVTKPPETSEEMVQDPVCQCYISKKQSYAVSLRGQKIFFCGEECYKKYLASNPPPKA